MKASDPRLEEATQFVIVNKTAKGVRSDLAEDFLRKIQEMDPAVVANFPARVISGYDWKPKAIDIEHWLNGKSNVWKNKIRFPNESMGTETVTQVSFTDSLKPILRHDSLKQFSTDEMARIISMYWDAIYGLCQEAIDNPADHVIQKTVGVYVLHEVMPDVLGYAASPGEKLTVEKIKKALDGIQAMKTKFWNSNGGQAGLVGTSRKAFGILATQIRAQLDQKLAEKPSKGIKPFEI